MLTGVFPLKEPNGRLAGRSGFGMLVAAMGLASPLYAATWAKLGTDSQGVTVFIDRDSLRKDGELRYFSLKFETAAPGQSGVAYTVMRELIDCKRSTITTLSLLAYRADGLLIVDYSEVQPVRPIASGSNGEDIALAVCRK